MSLNMLALTSPHILAELDAKQKLKPASTVLSITSVAQLDWVQVSH